MKILFQKQNTCKENLNSEYWMELCNAMFGAILSSQLSTIMFQPDNRDERKFSFFDYHLPAYTNHTLSLDEAY